MDKETRQLVDLQLDQLKAYKNVKQSRIKEIFRKYRGLDAYYMLINYESELIKSTEQEG